jgi:hypothetical protein
MKTITRLIECHPEILIEEVTGKKQETNLDIFDQYGRYVGKFENAHDLQQVKYGFNKYHEIFDSLKRLDKWLEKTAHEEEDSAYNKIMELRNIYIKPFLEEKEESECSTS